MFDTTATITIGLRTSQGKADITVRWPTDEEWSAQRKRRTIFQRQWGRGTSEPEIDTAEGDAKLYDAIKFNGAPPLTPAEASSIINVIQRAEVMGVDLRADDAEVELDTMAGGVKHVLRIPTMDQIRALQKTSRLLNLQYNRQQIITSLEAAVSLWDKCQASVEGYAGAVPNIHKDAAIRAVIQAIEQEATPKNDEASF